MYCGNCNGSMHTPDDRTGLIHTNGMYTCCGGTQVAEVMVPKQPDPNKPKPKPITRPVQPKPRPKPAR
jgi:hypothetical protein